MKYIVLFIILYSVGLFDFLGSVSLLLFSHYLVLAIGLLCFGYQVMRYKVSSVTFFIGLYCFLFPLYASYKSNVIFEQPFYMGVASLRYLWFILIGFFLCRIRYDYNLLIKQLNTVNIAIACLSIIAFFFLGINHVTIQSYLTQSDLIEKSASEDLVKGLKLYVCSGLMPITYIYYLLRIFNEKYKAKNWVIFAILMIYLVFVHKGRQPLALVGIVYAVCYVRMYGISSKRILLGILPILGVLVIIGSDESFMDKFTAVLEWEDSSDPSVLVRTMSINSVLPYIHDNLFLGFGNLSARFKEFGFQTFFGNHFYLADIGLWGTLARGGIVLLLIYIGIYYSLYKKSFSVKDKRVGVYMRYMILSFLVFLVFLSNDTLYAENCILLAYVFYPLFTKADPNIFIRQNN